MELTSMLPMMDMAGMEGHILKDARNKSFGIPILNTAK